MAPSKEPRAPASTTPLVSLSDEIYAATYSIKRVDGLGGPEARRRTGEKLRAALQRTRKYVVTDDAAAAAAVLGVQHPDVLLAMLHRARLPFPSVWIEWDQRVVLDAIGQPPEERAPPRTGVLVDQLHAEGEVPLYRMQEIGMDWDETPTVALANATAVVYSTEVHVALAAPWAMAERSAIARLSGLDKPTLDLTLIGSAYSMRRTVFPNDEREATDETEQRLQQCTSLMTYASHVWSEYWPSYRELLDYPDAGMVENVVRRSVVEFSGTWRMVIALIALIQARDYTTYAPGAPNAARRRFVGNRMVPYLQHLRVELALPREVVLRRVVRGMSGDLRLPRMEVEGHWKNRHGVGDPKCDHVWTHARRTVYRCPLCGWERWFQPSFSRGDAEVGFVTKDRVVVRRG